ISEAIQTILRREGQEMPYEKLKAATRGKKVTLEDLHNLVRGMNLPERVEKELLAITPENYVGIAEALVDLELA
ncbi:MAG: adenylosuccinate lyase, partial [Candidatus Aenigmatarchaeota archaeon]